MTTRTQPSQDPARHGRLGRSLSRPLKGVLIAALAAVVAAGTVTYLAPAPKAAAAKDGLSDNLPPSIFDSERGPTQTAATYISTVERIMRRAAVTPVREGVTETAADDDFFAVPLQTGDDNVQVVFNARDLYVVGFLNTGTNTYYRMGAGPANPFPGAALATPNPLAEGGYDYLQRVGGFDRSTQQINIFALENATVTLGGPNRQDPSRVARAITLIISMFAEGTRFEQIGQGIFNDLLAEESFVMGILLPAPGTVGETNPTLVNDDDDPVVSGTELTNNWGTLSRNLLESLQTGVVVTMTIGLAVFTTLEAYVNTLDVAKRS